MKATGAAHSACAGSVTFCTNILLISTFRTISPGLQITTPIGRVERCHVGSLYGVLGLFCVIKVAVSSFRIFGQHVYEFVTDLWVLDAKFNFFLPVLLVRFKSFLKDSRTLKLGVLGFRSFIMYHWVVCLLRRLWRYCAVGGAEFKICTCLVCFRSESFSIVRINSVYTARKFDSLSNLYVFSVLDPTIPEVAKNYVKWPIWAVVYGSLDS